MRIFNIQVNSTDERCRLSADVLFDAHWVWGDEPFPLWYEFPLECEEFVTTQNGDPFIAAFLSMAMFLGEPLIIADDAAVSPRLYSSIATIQEIYHNWDSKHSRVEIRANVRPLSECPKATPRSALFYSMGVDSNYSLSRCLEGCFGRSLPYLVMVEGFDVYLWERQRFPPMYRAAQEVADRVGTQVLPITTNLRDISDRITDWLMDFHGAALASTVLALGNYFSHVMISASQTYRHLEPRGAHPLLDPLWSTESTQFEHVGLEADRLGKVVAISRFDPSLLHDLRVCATSELTDAYNCGRCEKCIRTMIYLHIAGALQSCKTLPHEIDAESIRHLTLDNEVAVWHLEDSLTRLTPSDSNSQFAARLRERIAEFHAQAADS